MDNKNIVAIVLAAGQGKRMNSSLPKVAHVLLEKPLIIWVMESLVSAGIKNILPVISPTQHLVKEIIGVKNFPTDVNINFGYQDKQLGTAHAVHCGTKVIAEIFFKEEIPSDLKIVVAYGDTPAVKSETFKQLISLHEYRKNIFTILSFKAKNPYGYGRIIVDEKNDFVAIREQKDCSQEEEKIQICNSGIICANFSDLITILPMIENKNSANEYYLTDIPIYAKKRGLKIGLMVEEDESQFLGINTQEQLKDMEKVINKITN